MNPLLHPVYPLTDRQTLTSDDFPCFAQIEAAHFLPALEQVINQAKQKIDAFVALPQPHSWQGFVMPLQVVLLQVNNVWSQISHLHAVKQTAEIRHAYQACVVVMAAFSIWSQQHQGLYQAYLSLKQGKAWAGLTRRQQAMIDRQLLNFRISGVELPLEAQQTFQQIKLRLSVLATQFARNVNDAEQAWSKHITDEQALTGLPESVRLFAKAQAEQRGLSGWLLSLEANCVQAILLMSPDAGLRREIFQVMATRASDVGIYAGQFDNTKVIDEILALRQQLATLFDHPSYMSYSLESKTLDNPQQIERFLQQLMDRVQPVLTVEKQQLQKFASSRYGQKKLQPWDKAYYAELMRKQGFLITQEALRAYFPVGTVLKGLFQLCQQLFGLRFVQLQTVEVWDDRVQLYQIFDQQQRYRGAFYLDLFSRPQKRSGAWVRACRESIQVDNEQRQYPIAVICCNFVPPQASIPAMLTHDDVQKLFHEFGHMLHHCLTTVTEFGISGTRGVPWDVVELPSQLLEFWCWQPQVLRMISSHYQTGEPLSQVLIDKLLAAKNFQMAEKLMVQLKRAWFDFQVHHQYQNQVEKRSSYILAMLDDWSPAPTELDLNQLTTQYPNRAAHSFVHLFSESYGAGYYGYKWSEVLAADIFEQFKQQGIFNQQLGLQFKQLFLETGASEAPMQQFRQFVGRKPRLQPWLQYYDL